tara:strand:- start:3478 stop:3657 length:180 start_codon:yes stop_codon:yes gene_type:complete
MKEFDVETKCTYKTWVRVSADNEYDAQRKVNDMAWDITAIQYTVLEEAEATGTTRECPE